MKRIAYVKDIQLESTGGDPYFRIPGTDGFTLTPFSYLATQDGKLICGSDGEPVKRLNPPFEARQVAFLLERIADDKYSEQTETQGLAQLLREDARGEIRAQREKAKERGYWEFSDDMARRLMETTMKPSGSFFPAQPQLAFNFAPFIRAVKDQAPAPAPAPDLVVAEPTPANGAHASS